MMRWMWMAPVLVACGPNNGRIEGPRDQDQQQRREARLEVSDAEIGSLLQTLNRIEIRPSQVALQRAQDTTVRRFAEDMVQEHRLLQRRVELFLMENNMEPRDGDLSMLLASNLEPMVTELRRVPTQEFDAAYLVQQLASHRFALDTVDNLLLPSAEDEALERFLRNEVRPMFEAHLERAERIHQQMLTGRPPGVS